MSELIGSDNPFSADGTLRATLSALLGTIIPASTAHSVPGADDPAIFNDFLSVVQPFFEAIAEAVQALNNSAHEACNQAFSELDSTTQLTLAEQFRISHPEIVGLLVSAACQCYYRDDRVLASLGMPARAPFPEGFEVPEGDWSLLDPVRAQGPIYREIP